MYFRMIIEQSFDASSHCWLMRVDSAGDYWWFGGRCATDCVGLGTQGRESLVLLGTSWYEDSGTAFSCSVSRTVSMWVTLVSCVVQIAVTSQFYCYTCLIACVCHTAKKAKKNREIENTSKWKGGSEKQFLSRCRKNNFLKVIQYSSHADHDV